MAIRRGIRRRVEARLQHLPVGRCNQRDLGLVPNIDPYKEWTPLASLYPGDAYVNWTGLDVYNYDTPWMSFSQLAQSTYTQP